jgi:hypothetical protein
MQMEFANHADLLEIYAESLEASFLLEKTRGKHKVSSSSGGKTFSPAASRNLFSSGLKKRFQKDAGFMHR